MPCESFLRAVGSPAAAAIFRTCGFVNFPTGKRVCASSSCVSVQRK